MKHSSSTHLLKHEKGKAQVQMQSDSPSTSNQHKHKSGASHKFVLLILHVTIMSQILNSTYRDDGKGEHTPMRKIKEQNTLWYWDLAWTLSSTSGKEQQILK